MYVYMYVMLYMYICMLCMFICMLFKGNNGKVKLERPRLCQLDNSSRKACERG